MRFILYSPVAFEPWCWENADTGIGGSETSAVLMARGIAARGHEVICYAPLPDHIPDGAEWQGTRWYRLEAVDWSMSGWWMLYRCPEAVDKFPAERTDQVLNLLLQDWDYDGRWTPERVARMRRIVPLCRAHEKWLLERHPEFEGKTWVTRNGIRGDLIKEVEHELSLSVLSGGESGQPRNGDDSSSGHQPDLSSNSAVPEARDGVCEDQQRPGSKGLALIKEVEGALQNVSQADDGSGDAGLLQVGQPHDQDVPLRARRRNGDDVRRRSIDRNPKRIMYASSPDRGLLAALKIFKRAKEWDPELELHITYGFNNVDKLIERGAKNLAKMKKECLALIEETGAVLHGRLSQRELYREWLKTAMTVYLTSFWETGWITGLEASAMGAIPIFSPIWAQGENMKHGVPIPGDPNDPLVIARFADAVVRIAANPEAAEAMRRPMMRYVRERWDWSIFVEQWIATAAGDSGGGAAQEVLPLISVLTPTVRPQGLPMVLDSLKRQSFRRWEWLIACPADMVWEVQMMTSLYLRDPGDPTVRVIAEPEKCEGDFYCLNKAWNALAAQARGKLLVSWVDWTWAPDHALSRLWGHHEWDDRSVVSGVGDLYASIDGVMPEGRVWTDPRKKGQGVYQINGVGVEFVLCSVPAEMWQAVGGLDEDYDRGAGMSEKEFGLRLEAHGCKVLLDHGIEYKCWQHPKGSSTQWDGAFETASEMFARHAEAIKNGLRKTVHELQPA